MRTCKFQTIAAVVAAMSIAAVGCNDGDQSAGEKSGGDAPPVVLRLGTVEDTSAPYAPEVEHFASAIESRSGGSIDVEIVWAVAGDYTAQSEQQVATMVKDDKLDAAIVPTRVWDKLDVTSMQALQAPFVIDSLELTHQVATSDVAADMLDGLDSIGVEGLALWPESLRHPIGFTHPLLTPADFAGAQLRVPISDISYQLAEAIGAKPVDPENWDGALAAGELDGFESAFVWSTDLPAYGTFTGNVTFYPKVNSVVINASVFSKMSEAQQSAVQEAATETIAFVAGSHATERELADAYCADGGSVAIATDQDLAALVSMAAPLLTELEQDATIKRYIDDIRTVKATTTIDASWVPQACGPGLQTGSTVPPATQVEGSDSDTSADFPQGTYRAKLGEDYVATMTFFDGVWQGLTPTGTVDCEGTYTVQSGRIFMSNSTDVTLACGNPPGLQFLDAAWTLDGDQLRFVDINSDPSAVRDFGVEWTKIG